MLASTTVSLASSDINFPIHPTDQQGYSAQLFGKGLMSEDGIYKITCKMTNSSSNYFRLTVNNDYMNPLNPATITVNGTPILGEFYIKPGTSTMTIDNAQLGKVENVGDLNHAELVIYNSYTTVDASPWRVESCIGIKK